MKNIVFSLFIIFGMSTVYSQIGMGTSVNEGKWRIGGGVGLGFGNNGYFGFNISPYAGYAVLPNMEMGVTAGFQYGKNDYYKSNLFSTGPYVNYYIANQFFARGHYEYFSGTQTLLNNDQKFSFDESALWLGGGYQSTGRVRFQTGILYNVLYKENESIFRSPIRPFGGIAVSL
ncbi:MAG: hypothetical protein Q4G27_01550 [Flavobacteriaceae bacterium]|nr:hypothetical protein [Flavobacteriaceae bacterium]